MGAYLRASPRGARRLCAAASRVALAGVCVALASCAASEPVGEWAAFEPGTAWQLVLGSDAPAPDPGARIYDVDSQVAPEILDALRGPDGQTFVICYFSMGTWENWRSDAGDLPQHVIGEALPEWPGEYYLDLRDLETLVPWWEARLLAAKQAGCDAVDPDNLDAYSNNSGFDLSAADAVAAFTALADAAHSYGLAVGQKNAPELVPELVGFADFAVVEECFEQGFCDDFAPYIEASKAVLAVEYPQNWSPGVAFAETAWGKAWCDQAQDQDISLLISTRDLADQGVRCD